MRQLFSYGIPSAAHAQPVALEMKPAAFTYHAPDTPEEAVSLLTTLGDETKLIAGGQSLVPMMNLRLARPDALIDVLAISGLDRIEVRDVGDNQRLIIGAAARQATVMKHPDVARCFPTIPRALFNVGHAAIRNQGTIVGSVMHADPAAEMPAVLLAAGAEVVLQGPNGIRAVPIDDFFVTYFSTVIDDDELAIEIRIPVPESSAHRWGFAEVARRHGDFALVGAAVNLQVSPSDIVESARIALFGVGEVPLRVKEAEDRLVGERFGDSRSIADASRLLVEHLKPPADIHASSDYRKEVAGVVFRRSMQGAQERENR